jgi:putative ABC transport system permease protein
MGRKSYEIIGVFKSRGANYDDGVLLPYTTMRTNFDLDKFSSIIVRAKSSDVADIALRKVELALLRDLEEEEFEVLSSSDILGSAQEILGVITIALGAVAGISLLVGGVGIMNIMLVSVTERIREIGLRKAVGATPRVIAAQFLVESTLLSVIGGVIGLLLGFALTQAVQPFLRAEMTLQAVGMAFLFSLFVGVLFGTYPALNAAKKDVIEALRHE